MNRDTLALLEDVAALGACSEHLIIEHVKRWNLATRAERAIEDEVDEGETEHYYTAAASVRAAAAVRHLHPLPTLRLDSEGVPC